MMPYQGPGYVPPPEHYAHLHAGQAHLYQQNGQPRPMVRQPPQAQELNSPAGYRNLATPGHTQHTTPQQYNQGQPSFYQTPQYQQPYLSPPLQQPGLSQTQRYSPDPLQYYQQPPQPRQASPQAYNQQRQHASHQPAHTPKVPRRQPTAHPQWNQMPHSPSVQSNLASHSRASFGTPEQHRPQHQPRPLSRETHQQQPATQTFQQRPQSLPEPRRPSPLQHPGQREPQYRPSQQASPILGRPPSSQQQRSIPQNSAQQFTRTPSVNRPAPSSPAISNDSAGSVTTKAKVAQVHVPVQRAPIRDKVRHEDRMAPSPKRRRLSEGLAIPACETGLKTEQNGKAGPIKQASRVQQHQHQPAHLSQNAPTISLPTEFRSSPVPPTPTPAANLDYHSILLSLSDEYIQAAHGMSTSLAGAGVSARDLLEYHNLLAAGMNCLDTVIRNCAIPDKRKEARIRLRLASLLLEETENDWEAEETLSKGIPVCERARLSDLKYAMHHLLARISFKSGKYKAAMTAVDKLAIEADKLQLLHWSYAFRFLRVSFGLLAPESQRETSVMVKNLMAISQLASRNYHHAVEIVAATIEAMVHLKSRHADSVDLATRALATARTHQLTLAMTTMPQIRALLDCIDLACTLARFNHQLSQTKMQAMQSNMDAITRDPHWSTDGALYVPLGVKKDVDMGAETGGIMKQTKEGEVTLHFTWLTKTQVYSFGFLLSGLSVMNKSASNEQKAETFLAEGIKLSKLNLELAPQSLSAASEKYNKQLQLRIMLRLYVVFACCGRADWEVATTKGLEALRRDLAELDARPDQHLQTLMAYLEALCKHGLGDLDGALRLYQGADLTLKPETDTKPGATNVDPIKVLAALNSILIMRGFGQNHEADLLLQSIESSCVVLVNSTGNEHGNKAMEAAFYVMQATSSAQKATDSAIITTKKHLQNAVLAAKAVGNTQLLCIVMNIMTDAFFHNIVGDQAEKSAKAGRTLALKSQDKLWTAVADGMYAETLEKCGKKVEAEQMRREAEQSLQRLPLALKAALPSENKHY